MMTPSRNIPEIDTRPIAARRPVDPREVGCWRCGFTLIELMISVAILSILLGLGAFSFRRIAEGNALAQARNLVMTYAKVARSYAIAHRIETMMVVNPFNGRFELWHLNPPAGGGPFDPLSETTPDGYRFAPILDSAARLPQDGNGRPLAAVHPIDYAEPIDTTAPSGPAYRSTSADGDERNLDNLAWAAFCFDEQGRLVIRTRRIATRTFTRRNGAERPLGQRNRLRDETPDLLSVPLVNGGGGNEALKDTAITSTRGFVISDATRLRLVVPDYPSNAANLVNRWLLETRPGGDFTDYATTIVLNRFTGHELLRGGL
jgi:prepilin-type N-terminal cleavage/methylation domain-containing protein